MAHFSTLFWISFYMQDIQGLSPLDVGVRLLPQAIIPMVISPTMGSWMHKINNFWIMMVAALCQLGSSILLACVRQDSSYFVFIFPSLILSTLCMDCVRNVEAVSPRPRLLSLFLVLHHN